MFEELISFGCSKETILFDAELVHSASLASPSTTNEAKQPVTIIFLVREKNIYDPANTNLVYGRVSTGRGLRDCTPSEDTVQSSM